MVLTFFVVQLRIDAFAAPIRAPFAVIVEAVFGAVDTRPFAVVPSFVACTFAAAVAAAAVAAAAIATVHTLVYAAASHKPSVAVDAHRPVFVDCINVSAVPKFAVVA